MIKFFEEHYKLSWLITLFGAGLIFYISSLSFSNSSGLGGSNWLAVAYHFMAFFCFSSFLLISIVQGKRNANLFSLGIVIAFLYSLSDEFHQYFVPGRSSSLFDVGIDSLGIVFAAILYLLVLICRTRARTRR